MRRKPKAKLYLRFRTPAGKQSPYCPALFDHKSRIRPFWGLVKGVEEFHRDGTYHRRVKRDGKWKWESLGKDLASRICKARRRRPSKGAGMPKAHINAGHYRSVPAKQLNCSLSSKLVKKYISRGYPAEAGGMQSRTF